MSDVGDRAPPSRPSPVNGGRSRAGGARDLASPAAADDARDLAFPAAADDALDLASAAAADDALDLASPALRRKLPKAGGGALGAWLRSPSSPPSRPSPVNRGRSRAGGARDLASPAAADDARDLAFPAAADDALDLASAAAADDALDLASPALRRKLPKAGGGALGASLRSPSSPPSRPSPVNGGTIRASARRVESLSLPFRSRGPLTPSPSPVHGGGSGWGRSGTQRKSHD